MVVFRKNLVGRKAEVTLEFILTAILGITILFFVMGLFNDNLKVLANAGGINNLFHRDQVTGYQKGGKDYKDSQVTVATIGDQGLKWYMSDSEKTINILGARTDLSNTELINLAKALTVYPNAGGDPNKFGKVAMEHHIFPDFDKGTTTINFLDGKIIEWNKVSNTNSKGIDLPESQKIGNIANIIKLFN